MPETVKNKKIASLQKDDTINLLFLKKGQLYEKMAETS